MVNIDARSQVCPTCKSKKTLKPFKYGMGVPGEDPEFITAGCMSYPGAPELGCSNCDWTGNIRDILYTDSMIIEPEQLEALHRFYNPRLDTEIQIQSAGITLINAFAYDLFEYINNALIESNGDNWIVDLKVNDLSGTKINFNDPAFLLKDLVRNSQSILRKPLNSVVPKAELKNFYDRLAEILGERNAWFHNQIQLIPEQLELLIILILKVVKVLNLKTERECNLLLKILNKAVPGDQVTVEVDNKSPDAKGIVKEFENLTQKDDLEVGASVDGIFIPQSYTLHLNGSIRDRKTDQLLEEIIPDALTLGTLLIARKPSGGRLRITNEGIVVAYFNDYWGFLAKVKKENWFPGHLN